MYFLLLSIISLPLSFPTLLIAYRQERITLLSNVLNLSTFRLIKNKFFGSVFNITTTAMCITIGVLVPVLSAANISFLVSWEANTVCVVRPLVSWVLASTIFLVGFVSLLYKYDFFSTGLDFYIFSSE